MEITWLGHACFRMTERNLATVVCDPYHHEIVGYEPLKLKADIVTVSSDKPGHNYLNAIKSETFAINSPGEYEVGNVFINGHKTNKKGELRNTAFMIEFNGLFIAHFGNIRQIPSNSEIETYGNIHIMLVPVGGDDAFTAQTAVELISVIKPNIVIPMHYSVPASKVGLDPLSKFLKEIGITQTEDVYSSYKVTNVSQLPEETKVIILDHPLGGSLYTPVKNE